MTREQVEREQDYRWVATPEESATLATELQAATCLAVDTEANSFHAYRGRLCLVQLAWRTEEGRTEVALVDVLAEGAPLAALGPLLEDPDVEKIIHGADNDVRLLDRDAGIALRGLFDTQIAARLLGFARTGLASLGERYAGVEVSKSGQKLDWARRPLPEAALRYAARDAALLFPIHEGLGTALAEEGREDWAREEFALLETVRYPEPQPVDPAALASRITGAGALDPRRRGVLHALLGWREAEAERRDVPAVHIVPPKQLLAIARAMPRRGEQLEETGLSPRLAKRYGKSLLRAVQDGLARGPLNNPKRRPGNNGEPPTPPGRFAALRQVRAETAAALGIEEGLLCPTAVLKAVARLEGPADEDLARAGMRRWQIAAFAGALQRACEG